MFKAPIGRSTSPTHGLDADDGAGAGAGAEAQQSEAEQLVQEAAISAVKEKKAGAKARSDILKSGKSARPRVSKTTVGGA